MNPDPASLDRLHDLIVPPPVPWWPPAPGWQWLLALVFLLACALVLRSLLHWQRNRYRREALAECRRLQPLLASPEQCRAALTALAELLKRTALSAFPRAEVAALTGPAWLAFLDHTAGTPGFATENGALLERAAYGELPPAQIGEAQARAATALVRHWLMHHRADAPRPASRPSLGDEGDKKRQEVIPC